MKKHLAIFLKTLHGSAVFCLYFNQIVLFFFLSTENEENPIILGFTLILRSLPWDGSYEI